MIIFLVTVFFTSKERSLVPRKRGNKNVFEGNISATFAIEKSTVASKYRFACCKP